MKFLIPLLGFIILVACAPQRRPEYDEELGEIQVVNKRRPTEQEEQQNQSAQYQFSSQVEDHINDLSQTRAEVRDGLAVKGMYSYSDGYFNRTVYYEADENGYRVVGEKVIPLEGPKIDLSGTASVENVAHGAHLKYTVQSVPADGPISKVVDTAALV